MLSFLGCDGDRPAENVTAVANITNLDEEEEHEEKGDAGNGGNEEEDENDNNDGDAAGVGAEGKPGRARRHFKKGETVYVYQKAEATHAPSHLNTELIRFEQHRPIDQRESWLNVATGYNYNGDVDAVIPVHRGYQAERVKSLINAPLKYRPPTNTSSGLHNPPMNPSNRDEPWKKSIKPANRIIDRSVEWSAPKKPQLFDTPQETTYAATKPSIKLSYNDSPVAKSKPAAPLPSIPREKRFPSHACSTKVSVAPTKKHLSQYEQLKIEFERPRVEKHYGPRDDNGSWSREIKDYFNTSAHTDPHVNRYKGTHSAKSKFGFFEELSAMVQTQGKEHPANIQKKQSKENANQTRILVNAKKGEYSVVDQNERMREQQEDWRAKSGLVDDLNEISKAVRSTVLSGGSKGNSTGHNRLDLAAEMGHIMAAAYEGQANHKDEGRYTKDIRANAKGKAQDNRRSITQDLRLFSAQSEHAYDTTDGRTQEAISAQSRKMSKDEASKGTIGGLIAEMNYKVPGAHRDDDKASVWGGGLIETHKENWQVNARETHSGVLGSLTADAQLIFGSYTGRTTNGGIIDRSTGIEPTAKKAQPAEKRDDMYYSEEHNVFDSRSSTQNCHHTVDAHEIHATSHGESWHHGNMGGANRATEHDVTGAAPPPDQGNCSIM